MKRQHSRTQGVMAATGMLILIFDSSLALKGARSGIELCIQTVIPSLFPFFVLSSVLTKSLSEYHINALKIPAGLLGIPDSASSILLPAFLGGYPVGAKCITDLYHRNQLSRKEAERMLGFCSNAGPSFLFGMISVFFPKKTIIWLLWLIHILSAILTASVIPRVKGVSHHSLSELHSQESSSILSAAKAIVLVCCWVILFRMLITFLDSWLLWLLPQWVKVLLIGILELTNGCCSLPLVSDIKLRFVLCSCMLSFGGICVLFQTAAVAKGLSILAYMKGKLIQTAFSSLLSFAFVANSRLFLGALTVFFFLILMKYKKSVAIPAVFLYNEKNKLPEA